MPSKEIQQQKLAANKEIAAQFQQGKALIIDDFKQIYEAYGLSPRSVANLTYKELRSPAFREQTGVTVQRTKYKKQIIYSRAGLPLDETNYDEKKRQIEELVKQKK